LTSVALARSRRAAVGAPGPRPVDPLRRATWRAGGASHPEVERCLLPRRARRRPRSPPLARRRTGPVRRIKLPASWSASRSIRRQRSAGCLRLIRLWLFAPPERGCVW